MYIEWIVFLFGPVGTPFEGSSFKALMRFPAGYPHEPPSLQFLSKIFHPNVFRDGKLCISTLQIPHPDATAEDSKLNWSAVLGVSGALQSVVSLLTDPNPDDPANPDAANLFLKDRKAFDKKSIEFSKKSIADLPEGIVKPVITAPILQREESGANKFLKKVTSLDDDEYAYDTDEQLELEEQLAAGEEDDL
jgi:ubiquitin-conjugating enzyme E2 R